MELEWTEFTKDEYPVTTCDFDGFTASVRLCNCREETGWGNRYWEVKSREGVVLGSGYTLGSFSGRQLCAAVLHVWGVSVPAHELTKLGAAWQNPRAG